MINAPLNCPQRELDMVRRMHANVVELSKGVTDLVIIQPNPGIGRRRGDTESILVLSQPIDPFSEDAQATGKYYHDRHALVEAERGTKPTTRSSKNLCGSCCNVLIYLDPGKYTDKHTSSEEGSAVIHHEDLDSLEASAKAACAICKPLFERIHRSFSFLTKYDDIRLECSWLGTSETAARRTIFFSATQRSEERMQHNYMNLYWLQTYAKEEYSCNFEPPDPKMPRGNNTDSTFCRELTSHWLQQCRQDVDSTHGQCQERDVHWLPARLLDVKGALDDGCLRLKMRDEISSPENYITLSYVWGAQGHKELPLLYSEDLEIGSEDSTSDWHREADSMSLTYRNALLNISADAFRDPFDGLFVQRDSAPLEPWKISIGEQCWYITTLPQWSFSDAESTASYWRAWIYRERQLAPRILHFGPEEIAWECCSPRHCSEKYPGGAPYALKDATYGGECKYQLMMRNAQRKKEDIGNETLIHTSWELLCNSFSRRGLTQTSDMPIIISSLAADFATILPQDKYMAGLWQSRLPHCLLWTTTTVRESNTVSNKEMASWSWLRLCNRMESQYNYTNLPILRVDWIALNEKLPFYDPQRATKLAVYGIWRKLRFEYVCNLNEMTPHEYGYVENVYVDEQDDKRSLGISYTKQDGSRCLIKYDSIPEENDRSYHCLFVTIRQSQNQRRVRGLLLQQTSGDKDGEEESPHFERVGTIEFLDEMALRVRYRVLEHTHNDDDRWTALEHEFRFKQANDTAPDDALIDTANAVPSDLYRYDVDDDYSWLQRLEPEYGVLI